ncbi:MAG: ABC transporter ATP-binding protein [Egibacteraceae bacterium]
MSTHVRLERLTKAYGRDQPRVVDALDLDVPAGRLVALLGPSGCGKTTTMKVVAGLLDPTAGDVTFDGASIIGVPAERRQVAMVFQKPLLFPHMTVAQNVAFGLRMRRVGRAAIRRRVGEMLDLVRLPGLEDRPATELSGGQEQRVALARALIIQPRVLLLDEPLSQLDANLRVEMRDLVGRVHTELGVTTMFVTHDQSEAVMLADRIGLMLDGRLQQVDPPQAFYERPATAGVARFFGAENLVAGTGRDGAFDTAIGRFEVARTAPDGPGLLVVRAEGVAIGDGPNGLDAVVARTLYLGTRVRVWVDVGGAEVQLSAEPSARLAAGDRVRLHLPPERCWVVPADGAADGGMAQAGAPETSAVTS